MRKIKILLLVIVGFFVVTYILGTVSWESRIFKNIVFSYLEKKLEKKISADSLKIAFLKEIEIKNLKFSDKKGFSLSAGKLRIDYDLRKLFFGGLVAECEAKDVSMRREGFTFLKPVFELLLTSYPLGSLKFQYVSTDIYLENETFIPKNLEAVGKNIKVYGNGSVSSDEIIDYRLKFLIASGGLSSALNVFDEVFKELGLGEGVGDWISLSFRIKGKKDKLLVIPTLKGTSAKD